MFRVCDVILTTCLHTYQCHCDRFSEYPTPFRPLICLSVCLLYTVIVLVQASAVECPALHAAVAQVFAAVARYKPSLVAHSHHGQIDTNKPIVGVHRISRGVASIF